ncbi:TIGR02270 family protein [Sorangium sp. So ce1000]|uniref:TIGR02270 family protein n=1 Tax=Sorangium sp. So ce1000 TaxID=3133325 RepID=UPI003F625E83
MNRVLVEIVERHADEASFLWERRERACRSPLFDLDALAEIDRRLQANLEGLVIAGDVGLEKSLDAASRGGVPELFVAVHIAAERGAAMALARLLLGAEKRPGAERAVVSALAWLSPLRASNVLGELLANECPPAFQGFAVAAHAARRQDPGAALRRSMGAPDAGLRARAFRAAGRLGRRDLLPELCAAAQPGEDDAWSWAAWAAVLLGDTGTLPSLWEAAVAGREPAASAACELAVRCVGAAEAAARLAELAASPEGLPTALSGAAARGDAACIPWILDVIEREPALSRRASWVYVTITGARLEPPLAVRAPDDDPADDVVARSVESPWEDLPEPDCAAIRAHWEQARPGHAPGERRLGGRALTTAWIEACLRTGAQPWRASAAVELLRASRTGGLFPVHAPGYAQAALLR